MTNACVPLAPTHHSHTLEHLTGSKGQILLSKEQGTRVAASANAIDRCLTDTDLTTALSDRVRPAPGALLREDAVAPHTLSLTRGRATQVPNIVLPPPGASPSRSSDTSPPLSLSQQRRLMRLPLGAWTLDDVDSYFPHWETLCTPSCTRSQAVGGSDQPSIVPTPGPQLTLKTHSPAVVGHGDSAMLLWSVRRLDPVPAWDSHVDATTVFRATGIVPAHPPSVTAFLQRSDDLMPMAAVRLERDRAEAWHWRARAQRLLHLHQEIQQGTRVMDRGAAGGGGGRRAFAGGR